MGEDSNTSTANAIGSGVLSITNALDSIRPDLMVVYADRFEGFAAVIASTQMNIPTAHIEGGDLTEGGALDDSVRHAMSKLAHIHFTTNHQATNRILGMGEEPWRVHTVGFPAIDLISEDCYASEDEILKKLPISTNRPIVLFTQHSVTTEFDLSASQLYPSISAIKKLAKEGYQIIITYPNNDAGGQIIIQLLEELAAEKNENILLKKSLGRYFYHGVLALAKDHSKQVVCVGNSSSGIKETPAFGCPTVNIGSRQQGRLRGDNVIDANYNENEIVNAVQKCIKDIGFREVCHSVENPYYMGGAGEKIAQILSEVELDKALIRKGMTLLGETNGSWYR